MHLPKDKLLQQVTYDLRAIVLIQILGTNFNIRWTPSNTSSVVSLDLGTGLSSDIQTVFSIASGIPNSGVQKRNSIVR